MVGTQAPNIDGMMTCIGRREAYGSMGRIFVKEKISILASNTIISSSNNNSNNSIYQPKLAFLVLEEDNLTLTLNEEHATVGVVWILKEGDTPNGNDGMVRSYAKHNLS